MKRVLGMIFAAIFILGGGLMTAQAAQTQLPASAQTFEEAGSEVEDLLASFDFAQIQNFLNGSLAEGQEPLSFKELMTDLMQGDFTEVFVRLMGALKESLFGEIEKNSYFMGQVLVIGLIGAVFANFSSIFAGGQISEAGFYVTYLLLFTFLASGFYTSIAITKDVIMSIVEFMRALLPAYFMAISFAGGSVTSAAGYGWMLFSISGVEWLFSVLFLPLVHIYILFILAGHMMKENIFSKMTELVETGIRWGLKTTAGLVLGFHLLQSMVTPYADSLKNTSIQRFVSIIPGIGQGAAAISQLVLGSGVLIKNTIGAGAVIILILICVIPIIKLSVILLSYRLVAALLQPICDKRMVSCISAAGNGCNLLLRMVITALILFAVSLAVICMAANVTYYAG